VPTYAFRDEETGEVFEKFMVMSSREKFLEDNPNYTQVPNALGGLVSSVGDRTKNTDGGWNEVINKAVDAHPHSPLADRYKKRSIKEIKTRDAVKKARDKLDNVIAKEK
tara:strand:- start:31 stop:357 length:327 start_codon:yes stop_codon:yes gene_type:complete